MSRGNYIRTENGKKKWTKADEEYLQEAWGRAGLQTIAKNLGRTPDAVVCRIHHMRLPPGLRNGDRISFNQFIIALQGTSVNSSYMKKRLEDAGFPLHRQTIRGANGFRFTTVDIEEFWQFAEKNKGLFDFSRMEQHVFGFEPEWAALKRRMDAERLRNGRKHNDPWTKGDDAELHRLLKKHCHTYTEIAGRLRRSEGAIKRRIQTLGIKERPVREPDRAWSEAEERRLMEMMEQGCGFDNIARELGRTALCVRGKHERITKQKRREQGR